MNLGMLRDVLLVRIASAGEAGMTRAMLRGDIEPIVEHRLTASEWRRSLDELLFILLTEGLVVTHRMRLTTTEQGRAAASRFLGVPLPARAEWAEVRDVLLVGRALGLEVAAAMRRRKLESAHGLRGAILEHSFGLPASKSVTVQGLRDTLARKAASKTPAAAMRGKPASSKTLRSRRAVERLLRRPREFASDAALLAELAAEQVGAQETSVPSLRKAILRKLIGRPAAPSDPVMPERAAQSKGVRPPAGTIEPRPAATDTMAPPPIDPDQFQHEVLRIARACADGWPGNRRAYIAQVWSRLGTARPEWGLTSETFKSLLVEAHKAGKLTLTYADLRSKDTIELVQASAVRDRHNEWHFVRVDD